MTETGRIQATITGSFIYVLLMQLDGVDERKGSVINLKQRLRGKLKLQSKELAKLADDAYNYVVQQHKGERLELDIGILIEGLNLNKITYMEEMFGRDITRMVNNVANKICVDNLTKEQSKNSWKITDELKEALEKFTFEYLKEK